MTETTGTTETTGKTRTAKTTGTTETTRTTRTPTTRTFGITVMTIIASASTMVVGDHLKLSGYTFDVSSSLILIMEELGRQSKYYFVRLQH